MGACCKHDGHGVTKGPGRRRRQRGLQQSRHADLMPDQPALLPPFAPLQAGHGHCRAALPRGGNGAPSAQSLAVLARGVGYAAGHPPGRQGQPRQGQPRQGQPWQG